MLTSLLAATSLIAAAPSATRYDVGERLRMLDRAWLSSSDSSRRAAAVPQIRHALNAYFASKYEDACRSLDEAASTMQGREMATEDAVTLRFIPPFAEPRTVCYLRLTWAYAPRSSRPIRVTVGSQSVLATPGRPLTLEVHPERLNPELTISPEAGYLVPVKVGSFAKGAYISLIKRPRTRIANLASAKTPESRQIAAGLAQMLASPSDVEADVPVIQQLFAAEMLEEGRIKVERAEQLWSVQEGSTVFRAAFPKLAAGAAQPTTVVIALPGPGWSENTFFEGYGDGLAVREALKRGWAFISARAGVRAVADCVQWLQARRGMKVERLFVMGHSSGGRLALLSAGLAARPRGIAAFAPAIEESIGGPIEVPVYLAVGRQDTFSYAQVKAMSGALTGRRGSLYEEFDPCEHLMIVADAIPSAYRFFDSL